MLKTDTKIVMIPLCMYSRALTLYVVNQRLFFKFSSLFNTLLLYPTLCPPISINSVLSIKYYLEHRIQLLQQ